MIKIKDVSFVKSAPSMEETVADDLSEIAFIGRSNVGKSSIINAITNIKGLAKSSSTPGKTRLINFFNITFMKDKKEYLARLVDLPGFGYARVSKSMKHEWQKNLTKFITERSSIRLFVHLIDGRHPNLDIDREVADYLQEIKQGDQEIIIIFTKADKLKQKDISVIRKIYPNALMVSNSSKKGIDKAIEKIFDSLFGVKID
jgi:GTP-binding protein